MAIADRKKEGYYLWLCFVIYKQIHYDNARRNGRIRAGLSTNSATFKCNNDRNKLDKENEDRKFL